ncbi:MarR family winged helix-turn-helix transcriptional regulator [Antrihabitans cavernicola]|uniref:MarR family transcriptional regulator n=1 Tax=Antrihabitans cavernicola TaxID=2495913 RepID=A0A5A7SFK4_9NOCA|nr:MarR family transcriptional regulator [Spelaeibacter cavernicola]KAA0024596.1 MarR family transcriptional regulator [Spelaeibacter cavernicola]
MCCVHPESSAEPTAQPRWLTAKEQRAWRAYMDGSQRLADYLSRDLQANHDMSLAEYRILVLLSESADSSLRMSDLADGVLSSRSRLTHQIRRMEAQGMVERSNCVDDGRGVLANLTPEGRRRLEEAAPTHVESVRRNFVDLADAAQLSAVAEVFEKVDATISRTESE